MKIKNYCLFVDAIKRMPHNKAIQLLKDKGCSDEEIYEVAMRYYKMK